MNEHKIDCRTSWIETAGVSVLAGGMAAVLVRGKLSAGTAGAEPKVGDRTGEVGLGPGGPEGGVF